MTEAEKELIDGKVKASGLSKTDFLIKTLSDKPIVCIDNGAEILSELKRQGNNLNQAVKSNYFGDTMESCSLLWANAKKFIVQSSPLSEEIKSAVIQRTIKQEYAEESH